MSSSQIFAAEALLRSVHEMAERFAFNASAPIIDRKGNVSQLRTRVEDVISSLLLHGRVVADDVARSLAMSQRTLARKLTDEGLNFTQVLQQQPRDLAVRYLDDPKLQISKVAWLLGFNECIQAVDRKDAEPYAYRKSRCDDQDWWPCPTFDGQPKRM